MILSETAKTGLLAAGWTPNRSIDISRYEELLTQNEYVINDLVRAVLAEFGGLVLDIPSFGCDEIRDTAHFDVIKAESVSDNVEILKRYADGLLVPLGQVYQNHITTFISLSGKVYGEYTDFWFLGDDIYDYINGLYQRRCGKTIYVPEMYVI